MDAYLSSALARVAFLEERQENSVPVELYEAKVAECEALKREKDALSVQCEERIAQKDAEHKQEVAELNQKLKASNEAQAALISENMDFKKQMEFWQTSHFEASSEKLTDEMDRMNAANYLLDDEEGFRAFLTCGLMEISNNAIERCFRHMALGRRNWLQCGSHEAAEHTAFMYSLVESCKMNKIDFGAYIEHVLREIMDGKEDYRSLLPNHIIMPQKETEKKVA